MYEKHTVKTGIMEQISTLTLDCRAMGLLSALLSNWNWEKPQIFVFLTVLG
jgi:hypothetical protein